MFVGENTSISSPLFQKRRGTACGGGDGISAKLLFFRSFAKTPCPILVKCLTKQQNHQLSSENTQEHGKRINRGITHRSLVAVLVLLVGKGKSRRVGA